MPRGINLCVFEITLIGSLQDPLYDATCSARYCDKGGSPSAIRERPPANAIGHLLLDEAARQPGHAMTIMASAIEFSFKWAMKVSGAPDWPCASDISSPRNEPREYCSSGRCLAMRHPASRSALATAAKLLWPTVTQGKRARSSGTSTLG